MHRRIHSGSKDLGKWKQIGHSGVGNVMVEEYEGWTLELTHRKVGATIRRDQFHVTLRRSSPAYEEQLPGFSSKQAALAAARKRVDLLAAVRRPMNMTRHLHRAGRRRKTVKNVSGGRFQRRSPAAASRQLTSSHS